LKDLVDDESAIANAVLDEDAEEVATYVAGYIGKQMIDHSSCQTCHCAMVAIESTFHENHYFERLSRNGLLVPSIFLVAFASTGFAILDVVQNKIIRHAEIPTRIAANSILLRYLLKHVNFTCPNQDHLEWGRRWAIKVITNVFFNNKRKHSTDNVREDQVAAFKMVRRTHDK